MALTRVLFPLPLTPHNKPWLNGSPDSKALVFF